LDKGWRLPEIVISKQLSSNVAVNDVWAAWLRKVTESVKETCLAIGAVHSEQIPSDWSIVIRAVTQSGKVHFIKASPPGDETRAAISALVPNDHPQLVHCIYSDIINGIQVLAYIPGKQLSGDFNTTDGLKAVGCLLAELHQLHIAPSMIPLSKWCNDLITPRCDVPPEIAVNIARCERLLATSAAPTWLHGDLHHGNIIEHDETGQLVAIDPKGLFGDPSFDICTFIRNHVPDHLDDEALADLLERRIRLIGDAAGYPSERAFAWAAAGNALSLVWDLPVSGELTTEHHCHLYRVLTQLNLLASRYGNV
jgi:hypothetical protein